MAFGPELAWASVYLVAGGLVAAVGALVFFARPDRVQNRLLALTLVPGGLGWALARGVRLLLDDPRDAWAVVIVAYFGWSVTIVAYPLFVATLDTPLVRPLRTRAAKVVALLLGAGLAGTAFLAPGAIKSSAVTSRSLDGVVAWTTRNGPVGDAWSIFWILFWTFAAVAAVHAHLRQTSPVLRRQTFWFAVAFAGSDALLALWLLAARTIDLPSIVNFAAPAVAYVLLAVCAAYGVVRAQLFDIDLKIKWGLSRGTVAAVFLGVFFVVAQVTGEFLSETYVYLAGGAAAGLLVFAFNPLQRAAQRVADAAMPGVAVTPEYVGARKRDVYRAALEGAMADGEVTAKERDILTRLQLELGISNVEARSIEAEASGARASA